eukprot:2811776-Prymnesium_polylepis.1
MPMSSAQAPAASSMAPMPHAPPPASLGGDLFPRSISERSDIGYPATVAAPLSDGMSTLGLPSA